MIYLSPVNPADHQHQCVLVGISTIRCLESIVVTLLISDDLQLNVHGTKPFKLRFTPVVGSLLLSILIEHPEYLIGNVISSDLTIIVIFLSSWNHS